MKRISIFILVVLLSLAISLPVTEATQKEAVGSLRGASSSISHLRLKGTLFTSSLNPLAIIEDTRSGQVTMYELGDIIESDFKIIDITRGEVGLKTIEGEFKISFPAGEVWQPQSSLSPEGENWYNIRREEDIFVVDEATVSNATRSIKEIMKNVKVSPYFVDGKPSGLAVTRFTPTGVLKEVGVREGDVIRSINGLRLNTPYQIFTAYYKLRSQQELKVDIIRDNQPQVLTYQIRK